MKQKHRKYLSADRTFHAALRFWVVFAAVYLALKTAHCTEWVGSVDSDFTNARNWKDDKGHAVPAAPSAATINETRLSVVNSTGFPLRITERENGAGFSEELLIGGTPGGPGEIIVSGGEVAFQQTYHAIIGQTKMGKMSVEGGKVLIQGGSSDEDIPQCEAIWSLYLGNEKTGQGELDVAGGEVRVENGLEIGRRGSSAALQVSGNGQFICNGAILFTGGDGLKRITLGKGDGLFKQNNSSEILFLGDNGWINFHRGSRCKLSLYGRDKVALERMVAEGRIRIDDRQTTPDHFIFRKVGNQEECQLTP